MPENPLLPHRKLRQLHALMLTCRALERGSSGPAREALLAATTMQLEAGDLLCGSVADRALAELAPPALDRKRPRGLAWSAASAPAAEATRISHAAALARGLQSTRSETSKAIVLALAAAGEPANGWPEALAWALAADLPLVLVCADATGGRPSRRRPGPAPLPLLWPELERVARKLRLPVLTVDGEDAVAMYRVMQEASLRARSGLGPAVIWAVLSPGRPAASAAPLARLRRYLAVRGISIPKSGSR